MVDDGDIDHAGMHIKEMISFKRTHESEELLVLHDVSDVAVTVDVKKGRCRILNEVVYNLLGSKAAVKNRQLPIFCLCNRNFKAQLNEVLT